MTTLASDASMQAALAIPEPARSRGHTGRIVRVAGSFDVPSGRSVVVRARVTGGPTTVIPVVRMATADGRDRGDWDGYLPIPRARLALSPRRSLRLVVEVDDGRSTARFERRLMTRFVPLRNDTYAGSASPERRALVGEHLRGRGLEFGALHQPLVVDPSCEMRYVDRLTRADAVVKFPELAPFQDQLVEPDYLLDLDVDPLDVLAAERFDFFVAGDVLEHLANPLEFLRRVHDVMAPGSQLYLVVPDRDFTFDARRRRTSWRHLARDLRRHADRVSDLHVLGFLWRTRHPLPRRWGELRRNLEVHRARSVHVHVWDDRSFLAFLERARLELDLDWELVAHLPPARSGGAIAVLLRKHGGRGPGDARP